MATLDPHVLELLFAADCLGHADMDLEEGKQYASPNLHQLQDARRRARERLDKAVIDYAEIEHLPVRALK